MGKCKGRKTSNPLVFRKEPLVVLSLESGSAALMHSILEHSREFGWQLLNLRHTPDELLDELSPIGAISSHYPSNSLYGRLRKLHCPVVRVGSLPTPKDAEIPAVLQDMQASGRLATDYFFERGFRHMGFHGRTPWGAGQAIYEALAERAAELGCTSHLLQIPSEPADTPAEKLACYWRRTKMVANWFEQVPKPIGMMHLADGMAAKSCVLCLAAGLAVPEDVALLGRGDHAFNCESAPVPLSSIDTDDSELGRQAVALLARLMAGEGTPSEAILVAPKGVTERRSTDVMAVPDPVVARALRFLWDNFDEQLSVDDIASEASVSRSTLERGFRKCLGRGVNAELRRKRLERIAQLLRETSLPIAQLAPMAGYQSLAYLHRSFLKTYGVTPREYRLQRRSQGND